MTRKSRSPSSSISSSISILSVPAPHSSLEDTPDEFIIWTGSESCVLPPSVPIDEGNHADDDDFVLISPATPPSTLHPIPPGATVGKTSCSIASLMSGMQGLHITTTSCKNVSPLANNPPKRKRQKQAKRSKAAVAQRNESANIPAVKAEDIDNVVPLVPSHTVRRKDAVSCLPGKKIANTDKRMTTPAAKPGYGARAIVDDISECGSAEHTFYKKAVQLMTSILSSPELLSNHPRLAVLQALIVELGLVTSEVDLPTSIRAAKSCLKKVHVNILDYIAVRGKGVQALQQIMHKSKKSLMKDIRKKKKRAYLAWVKDSGLSALLVSCYY